MKTRFTTVDIRAAISEINKSFLGMRVVNVYDIDNKTYLIRLAKPDMKAMILLESGNRIHSTEFDWPKNMTPSTFSMKLRKHLRTRRLEKIEQLGVDRIVDLQFGSGEAAYHIILELYDRGNIVLTDYTYNILNILRPRTDTSQDVKLAVREIYPLDIAKQHKQPPSQEELMSMLLAGNDGDHLKKCLNPNLVYGPSVIEHCLLNCGLPANPRLGKEFKIQEDLPKLMAAIDEAEVMLKSSFEGNCKGFIIQKKEKKPQLKAEDEKEELLTYSEFHPFLYKQHEAFPHVELESFNKATDEFFSKMGSQKLDMKVLQQEKAAMKKLQNVRVDHERRLGDLQQEQQTDTQKGQLIELNLDLVDRAIKIVRSAVANQIDWTAIMEIVKEAQANGDPVAQTIKSLKLDINHITLLLRDSYGDSDDDDGDDDDDHIRPTKIDIDLGLSAYANARRYYDMKRHAATKEQKTIDASTKALKAAEKKTKQTLKEVQTTATINKARKTYWFEKFLWFLTSENYLVVGGRDRQQNELIVRRYLKPGDLYVHADLHGASSVIIKNPSGEQVPPKSLNEAGTMALCNSAAWDAKVVTSAWWVYHDQVSKTAPTGEYLTTGSFMVRGKKNFLPPSYLVYGFGFLFKLDETSIFRHIDERKVRTLGDDYQDSYFPTSEDTVSTGTVDTSTVSSQDASDSENSEDEISIENDTESIKEEDDKEEDVEVRADIATAEAETAVDISGDNVVAQETRDEGSCSAKVALDVPTEKTENIKDGGGDDESDSFFPDTNIQLQHIKGETFTLQSNFSSQLSTEETPITLGDDKPVSLGGKSTGPARLSAKQRRDLKKKGKAKDSVEDGSVTQKDEVKTYHKQHEENITQEPNKAPAPHQPEQLKRGQKAKLKKMKQKYKDQDEEERNLRMEILASAGPPKEDKKKKGRKGKQQEQQQRRQQQAQQNQVKQSAANRWPEGQRPPRKLTVEDIKMDDLSISNQATEGQLQKPVTEDPGQLSDEEKQTVLDDENIQITEDASILDSLTGNPVPEDILLFSVPVCGPYSALLNYKYKVKLIPGSTKRGKEIANKNSKFRNRFLNYLFNDTKPLYIAAKTALNMFVFDKNATAREKDLLKSVKDTDLSRNLPGKVKVSAPNLQKMKKK